MVKKEYKNRKYTVEMYNPLWKKKFLLEAKHLQKIFGSKAELIEHVGSTSIKNMVGKPTIDILVVVKNILIADKFTKRIESEGYTALGEYVNKGSRLFTKEKNGFRLVNLHIFEEKSSDVNEMLAFKNYLQTHPKAVEDYSKLKFRLAQRFPNNYGKYREHKDKWMRNLSKKIANKKY